MAEHSTDFIEPRRPWWTRPGFLAAAVLLVLVLVAGVGLALRPGPRQQGGNPPPGTTAAPVTASASGSPAPASPEATVTTPPTVAPQVTWQLVGQVAVPVSRTDGPSRATAAGASGFARTPVGALIAAAQLATRAGLSAGKASWEPTITEQFVPGPDRDALLERLRFSPDAPAAPGELAQIAGFRYISYTADTAVVGLVRRVPGGAGAVRYTMSTVTLRWAGGDWRMVAPPGGSWTSVRQPLTDLSGVVEWGAR